MSRSRPGVDKRIVGLLTTSRRSSRNDPQRALRCGLEALDLAQSQGLHRRAIEAKIVLSVLHIGFCDYPSALECLDAAAGLLDPAEESPESVKILLNYGAVYRELGRHRIALGYFTRAVESAERLGEGALLAVGVYNCGILHGALGDVMASLEMLFRAVRIWSREDPLQAAVPHYDIALIFARVHLTDKALSYLQSSYDLYRQMPNKQGEAVCLAEIGRIHHSCGDHQTAEIYLQKALAIALKVTARSTEITIRRTLGGLYHACGDADRAHDQYMIAAGIAQETGSVKQRVVIAREIAVYLRDREEYQRAIDVLLNVLDDAVETSDVHAQMGIRHELMHCHEKLSQIDLVVVQLKEIIALHRRNDEQSLPATLTLMEERMQLIDAAGERDLLRMQHVMLERETRHLEQDLSEVSLKLRRRDEALSVLHSRMRDATTEGDVRTGAGRGSEEMADDVCADFSHQIDDEHREFTHALTQRFRSITPVEMKICCLLRTNLTTKEISRLMCITPKSVEVYRTRIRRKLLLDRDQNLIVFLQSIR